MLDIITSTNSGVSRQALQQQAEIQQLVRLFRGVYVNAQEYGNLDFAGQYRVRAKAFLATHSKLRAWGITAAALEGAPILKGAPLHFAGKRSNARSKYEGCIFHTVSFDELSGHNSIAQLLFECATTSPLPDAIMAANYLLRRFSSEANGSLIASWNIDEKTTDALIWMPVDSQSKNARRRVALNTKTLNISMPDFLETYSVGRKTDFTSPKAELIWLEFVQLCVRYRENRGVRKALKAGLFFSDQPESPAESLLIAQCAELGFEIPYLQVNIIEPSSGKHLGRVDGLWPSRRVLKGLYQSDGRYGRFLQCRQLGDNDSVIIEFDGDLKYQEDYAEVLEKERQRQNAIGNLGFRFVRIGWNDLMHPDRLFTILKAAHVPSSRRR